MKAVEATLRLHPDLRFGPLDAFVVQVARPASRRLALRFDARGSFADLKVALPSPPKRVDELWRHTCFEAFVRTPDGDRYLEFNLAPSSQWAAYAFSDYRLRDDDPEMPTPPIRFAARADGMTLAAELDLSKIAGLDGPWDVAISAVIEDKRGERSYWALAHPPGKPDFHHKAAFTLHLPPPDRP
jgi:hypothetical protein